MTFYVFFCFVAYVFSNNGYDHSTTHVTTARPPVCAGSCTAAWINSARLRPAGYVAVNLMTFDTRSNAGRIPVKLKWNRNGIVQISIQTVFWRFGGPDMASVGARVYIPGSEGLIPQWGPSAKGVRGATP